ncbi:ribonuclease HII [Patescibacteria group bacterium]
MEKSRPTDEIFQIENHFFGEGDDFIFGVDEAGRGPLVGPVVAATVMISKECIIRINESLKNGDFDENIFDFVRDSKKLTEKKREEVYEFIVNNFYVGVGVCDHDTVDRINILQASFLSMKKAIVDLRGKLKKSKGNDFFIEDKSIILVDGNKTIPNLSGKQKAFIQGDKNVKLISAASIVAKVTRDRLLYEMHEKYPQYGFDRHKGYGTKIHMEALKKHGPCEYHRKSFGPVKRYLKGIME